jgi:hypothetical protein
MTDITLREVLIHFVNEYDPEAKPDGRDVKFVDNYIEENMYLADTVVGDSIEPGDLEGQAKKILLQIASGQTAAAQYEDGSGVLKATMDQRVRACEAILGDDIRTIAFTYTGPTP